MEQAGERHGGRVAIAANNDSRNLFQIVFIAYKARETFASNLKIKTTTNKHKETREKHMTTKTITSFLALLGVLLMAGCSSVQKFSYRPKANDSSLLVARKASFNAGGIGAIIHIDGQNVVKLGGNEFASIRVSPGPHQIGVKATVTAGNDSKQITVSANQKRYFVIEANPAQAIVAMISPLTNILAVKKFLLKDASEGEFQAIAGKGREQTVAYSP
jgi:hypothetical protein